jgi:hypothetical protein
MEFHPILSRFTFSVFAIFACHHASAAATLGGVVSMVAGSGTCNYSKLVPLDTPQDTFVLSGATGCSGGSSSVDLHGDAATGTVGLRATSSGNGLGSSQASAQVYYSDHWLISVPMGTAVGTYTIPVSLTLEGNISPGALSGFNRFMDYNLSIRDLYAGLSPNTLFQANGSISSTGAFTQTFSGNVDFRYFGPGSALPMTAEVIASLVLPGLNEGVVDFYNTASISMDLPSGFSVTTSSGLPLVFAPAVPVPPAAYLLGSALIGLLGMRKKLTS